MFTVLSITCTFKEQYWEVSQINKKMKHITKACGFLLQKRYVLTLIAKNFDNRKPINIKFKRNNLLAKMIIAARKKSKKTKYFWF